ncbi:hypothetical protein KM043_015552 [Ampulex compressa]|nr:hypothetical protein KM043_015552 [Ampulex compressa]
MGEDAEDVCRKSRTVSSTLATLNEPTRVERRSSTPADKAIGVQPIVQSSQPGAGGHPRDAYFAKGRVANEDGEETAAVLVMVLPAVVVVPAAACPDAGKVSPRSARELGRDEWARGRGRERGSEGEKERDEGTRNESEFGVRRTGNAVRARFSSPVPAKRPTGLERGGRVRSHTRGGGVFVLAACAV